MTNIINLTPHPIVFRHAEGQETTYPPSGSVARVSSKSLDCEPLDGMPTRRTEFGAVEGLPEPREGVCYVVSLLVLGRPECAGRDDIIAPATGPQDGCVRDGQGRVTAVTMWLLP